MIHNVAGFTGFEQAGIVSVCCHLQTPTQRRAQFCNACNGMTCNRLYSHHFSKLLQHELDANFSPFDQRLICTAANLKLSVVDAVIVVCVNQLDLDWLDPV